jgi:hypothetical protein
VRLVTLAFSIPPLGNDSDSEFIFAKIKYKGGFLELGGYNILPKKIKTKAHRGGVISLPLAIYSRQSCHMGEKKSRIKNILPLIFTVCLFPHFIRCFNLPMQVVPAQQLKIIQIKLFGFISR